MAGKRRSRGAALLPRTRNQYATLAVVAVALIVAVVLPYVVDEYYMLVLYQALIYIALAQAWNLLAGYGGLVSLAPAASVGIGMYTSAVLANHFNLAVPLLIIGGGIVAGVFALLVSVPMFRFRGLYFAIATLVLGTALGVFMVNWNGLGGAVGLFLSTYAPSAQATYYYSLALAVVSVVIVYVVLRTRLGLSLRAIRDDEDTAQEIGVSTFRTKLWVWVVSSFLIGMVGGLQAVRLGTVEPYGAFSLTWTIDIVSTTIVGGIGTIVGPIIGAGFTTWLGEALAGYPEIHVAINGVIVILIIRFAPTGIWGIAVGAYKRLAGRARAGGGDEPARTEEHTHAASLAADGPRLTPAGEAGAVMLKTDAITKRYGDVVAVSEVSIEVRRGEVLGIIGPNGAGKSTVVGMLSGALNADGGTVEYEGADVTHMPAYKRARMGIGRTHQIPRPFRQMTVLREPAGRAPLRRPLRERPRRARRLRRDPARPGPVDGGAHQGVRPHASAAQAARAGACAGARAAHPAHGRDRRRARGVRDPRAHRRHQGAASPRRGHRDHRAHHGRDHASAATGSRCSTSAASSPTAPCRRSSPSPRSSRATSAPGARASCRACRRTRPRRARLPSSPSTTCRPATGASGRVNDITFDVHQGEVVALLGTNGAGKTTAARVISGMIPATAGKITFAGADITSRSAHEVARRGLAHCMEGRHIFADLTRAREPRARRHVRRPQGRPAGAPGPGLRPLRGAGRAAQQVRQAALGRPAAAARHRPLADGRPRR